MDEELRMMPSDRLSNVHSGFRSSAPSSRRAAVIEQLLERYNDLVDPMQSGNQQGDTGLRLMPQTYTPTVRELERLIRLMRDDRHHPLVTVEGEKVSVRKLWWHLNAWYIAVEHKTYTPPLKVAKGKNGKLIKLQVDDQGVALPQVRVLRSPEARYQLALKAVEWLSASWGLVGEPMLPRELVQAA